MRRTPEDDVTTQDDAGSAELAIRDAAFTVERWLNSLHEDHNGLVWVTKAELRAVLVAPGAALPARSDEPEDDRVDVIHAAIGDYYSDGNWGMAGLPGLRLAEHIAVALAAADKEQTDD